MWMYFWGLMMADFFVDLEKNKGQHNSTNASRCFVRHFFSKKYRKKQLKVAQAYFLSLKFQKGYD